MMNRDARAIGHRLTNASVFGWRHRVTKRNPKNSNAVIARPLSDRRSVEDDIAIIVHSVFIRNMWTDHRVIAKTIVAV